MRLEHERWMRAVLLAAITGCNGGGGGDGEGNDGDGDDDPCPGGVCLPTEDPETEESGVDPSAGSEGPGTSEPTTSADEESTGTMPPDGVCDPAHCDPWDIAVPPDGTAQRVCSDPDCETAAVLPALDENYFRCRVMAVFQEGCANMGCHSPLTPARSLRLYGRFAVREFPIHSGSQDEEVLHDCASGDLRSATCARHPLTALEWATNFDSARLFMIDVEDPATSELLTQPLADDAAGLEHAAIDNWAGTNDVRYQTVLDWLSGATEPSDCTDVPTPAVVGSEDNTVAGYFQFSCPQCNVGPMMCVDSGETPPLCDPNACVP